VSRSASLAPRLVATVLLVLLAVGIPFLGMSYLALRSAAIDAMGGRLSALMSQSVGLMALNRAAVARDVAAVAHDRALVAAVRRGDAAVARALDSLRPRASNAHGLLWVDSTGQVRARAGAAGSWEGATSALAAQWRPVTGDSAVFTRVVGTTDTVAYAVVAALPGNAGTLVHWRSFNVQGSEILSRALGATLSVAWEDRLSGDWVDGAGRRLPSRHDAVTDTGASEIDVGGTTMVAAARPVPSTPWRVIYYTPRAPVIAPARHLLYRALGYGGLLVTIAMIVMVGLTRRALAPLGQLTAAAERVAAGDFAAPAPARERDDEIGRLTGAFTDMVTALRTMQDREAVHERRFRDLFFSVPLPMWVFDTESLEVLECNDLANAHYGYTREEFIGLDIRKLRRPEDVPRMFEAIRVTGPGISSAGLWTHLRKDGTEIRVEPVSHAIRYQGRNARIVVIHDVTERERLMDRERASERRLQELVSAAPLGITMSDPTGRLILCNRAFATMLGYADEADAMTASANRFWVDMRQRASLLARVAAEGQVRRAPATLRRKDGTVGEFEVTSQRVEGPDGPRVETFIEDVTELRRTERKIQQAAKMEAVGQLAAGVAHDFNNLLTVILGNAEVLAADLPASDPRRQALDEITAAGRSAATLARKLLIFSRQDVVAPSVIDVNARLRETARLLERALPATIALTLELDPAAGTVRMDAATLEQAIVNLVLNARDAMPEGGRVQIATLVLGTDTVVEVRDSGLGMDEATRARIFEPFFTTKPVGSGTGLGLASVYAIAASCGGHVDVESVPGQGSTFRLVLPRAGRAPDATEIAAEGTTLVAGHETVLVVEDQAAVRTMVASALARRGYRILEATDGEHALRVAGAHRAPIALVLSDIVMPHGGARPYADAMAAIHPESRILYMSGYSEDALVRMRVQTGAAHFIAKPFTGDALARKVRTVLDSQVA
jgi:PAS domain S-box-containing protein